MNSDNASFQQFQDLLREMFQFDHNELDFGLFKVLRLKRNFIEQFFDGDGEQDLKSIVARELANIHSANDADERQWIANHCELLGKKAKLACSALAVVANSLPIRTPQAARFVARLVNRAVHYSSIVNQMGRGIAWSHIVSGLLRMELATDIIGRFHVKGFFNDEVKSEIQLKTNIQLNPLDPSWYESLLERLLKACSSVPENFDQIVESAIAASDAIRYVHLGNPESIIIADQSIAAKAYSNNHSAHFDPR